MLPRRGAATGSPTGSEPCFFLFFPVLSQKWHGVQGRLSPLAGVQRAEPSGGVQGRSPCMNGAFSQSKFSQKIGATRPKPPRRGDLGRAAARRARLWREKYLDKKPELSDIQLFVWMFCLDVLFGCFVWMFCLNILFEYKARNGFFPSHAPFGQLSVGLPPSRSAPAGRFGRAAPICCANGLLGKRARYMQGLCPCTPPGTVTVPGPLQLF